MEIFYTINIAISILFIYLILNYAFSKYRDTEHLIMGIFSFIAPIAGTILSLIFGLDKLLLGIDILYALIFFVLGLIFIFKDNAELRNVKAMLVFASILSTILFGVSIVAYFV